MLAPAIAGDIAEFRSHGFSQDGRYFSFEEFGRQDGSGFAYSNIYILDLKEDKWMPDSPVRVLIRNESGPVLKARFDALSKAAPLLQRYNITNSGVLMAASPINEAGNKHELAFKSSIPPSAGGETKPYILYLSQYDLPDRFNCYDNGKVKGFRLDMTLGKGGIGMELYEDRSIPKSRNCPLGYQLVSVYAPDRFNNHPYAVALVGVFSRGFEGPDFRYIAVSLKF
jgi:predicted secreted protein